MNPPFPRSMSRPRSLVEPPLRGYQQQAVDIVCRDLFGRGGRDRAGYIELPTGGGKTRVAIEITGRVGESMRTLVLVPSLEIALQIGTAFAEAFGADVVGRCYGGFTELDRPITIAIPASLKANKLARYVAGGQPIFTLADEAHHVAPGSLYAQAIRAAQSANPRSRALGLTATPFRHDGVSFESELGRCLFSRSIEDLQELGVLAPFDALLLEVPELRLADVGNRGGDFDPHALEHVLREVTNAVVRDTAAALRGRIALAFAASLAHAQELTHAFARAGFRAGFVWGTQPKDERADVLERWRRRDLDLVVNVGCLLEGFDFPAIDALLIARPTQSPGLYLQMIGRGLRTAPGKGACLVIDVAGNDAPDQKRQLLLRDLVRERSAGKGSIAAASRSASGTSSRQKLHRERERDFDFAWLERNGDEGLMVGEGTVVIGRVDRDAGLFLAAYATKAGRKIQIIGQPTSHAQALAGVLAYAHTQLEKRPVWRRDAGWRASAATDRQRSMMERLEIEGCNAPTLSRGAASDAISGHIIEYVAGMLRKALR